ncbi:hypothetical protein K8R42_01410 [bacterium]|nr:hypothetical protein [bacterium]
MSTIESKEEINHADEENFIRKEYYSSPVLSVFLMDSSGSMGRYRQDVIEGQKEMLSVLRQSKKCRDNALIITQVLFSDKISVLNSLNELSTDGNDQVVILNESNYNPNSTTALYRTTFKILEDLKRRFVLKAP